MKCPRDHSGLEKIKYENVVELDHCPTCGGYWLDKGELEKIQDARVNDYSKELKYDPDEIKYVLDHLRVEKNNPPVKMNCPVCAAPAFNEEYVSLIYVNKCPHGHGIWLDKEEMQQMEVFFERSRMEAKELRFNFFDRLLDFLKIRI